MGFVVKSGWTVVREPLGPGRLLLQCGPMHTVIQADPPELVSIAAAAALQALEAVASHRDLLRRFIGEIEESPALPAVVQAMIAATRATGEREVTPMVCVAGAIADAAADAAAAAGAQVVTVNNGGDIALRLAPGQRLRVGLHSGLAGGRVAATLEVSAADCIGGICTSGLGGRSLTRGIASAVTALAPRATAADAAATLIANRTFVPHPGVIQAPACTVDPGTDLRDLPVTVSVAPDLPAAVWDEALRRGVAEAERLRPGIYGAVLFVGPHHGVAGNVNKEELQWRMDQ